MEKLFQINTSFCVIHVHPFPSEQNQCHQRSKNNGNTAGYGCCFDPLMESSDQDKIQYHIDHLCQDPYDHAAFLFPADAQIIVSCKIYWYQRRKYSKYLQIFRPEPDRFCIRSGSDQPDKRTRKEKSQYADHTGKGYYEFHRKGKHTGRFLPLLLAEQNGNVDGCTSRDHVGNCLHDHDDRHDEIDGSKRVFSKKPANKYPIYN